MEKLTRRSFLAAAGASAAGAFIRPARAADRPLNLLFLMTDQHHHGVLGCMGNPLVKTPNLDRLAAEGVRFTHAVCPVPFCSPTRAAIATGRYPSTLGIWRNIKARGDPLRLREPTRSYFHQLAARGYHCHQLGKWHLGDPAELSCFPEGRRDVETPRRMLNERRRAAGAAAFDHGPRPGETLVGQVFMTEAILTKHRIWEKEKRRSKQDLSTIGRSRFKPEFHYESVLADYCIELLRRHREEPFAIVYSVSPPHALWVAPAPFYDMYDPRRFELPASFHDHPQRYAATQPARMGKLLGEEGIREYLRCYYAQVTMMDWCMGRILGEVRRLGLAENTLVVFTSDHGDMQAAHGMMGKSLPGYYDEILRVPLLMRLPGVIPRGRVSEALASNLDLPATILDYLGLPALPSAHARSLRPLVEGKADDGGAVFAERGDPKRNPSRMVRTKDWKLALYADGYRELFNLRDDPGEMNNLAGKGEFRPVVARLVKLLKDHMERIGDPALPALARAGVLRA